MGCDMNVIPYTIFWGQYIAGIYENRNPRVSLYGVNFLSHIIMLKALLDRLSYTETTGVLRHWGLMNGGYLYALYHYPLP